MRRKEKKNCKWLGLVQPKSCSVWHTGLSGGAPDSVRCARLASGEQATLGKNRWRTAIIHQSVRWANGRQRNGRPRNPRATRGPHQRSAEGTGQCPVCTGQCPVRQLPQICNGRLRQNRKEIGTGPSTVTVRWRTGLSGAPPDRRQGWPSLLASNGS
jgi:hypothetical protein